MTDLTDKLIIFLSCFAFYALSAGNSISVTPTIAAITFSALLSYFDRGNPDDTLSDGLFSLKKNTKLLRLLLAGIYFVICEFQPEFMVFLPLICYDVFVTNEWYFSLFALVPFISHLKQSTKDIIVTIVVFSLVSFILKYRTVYINKLHLEFTKYRDSSMERSILLEKNNKDLMEKQDYEINVATLNERNRIAMEIHDNVGHMLSRCLLQIGAVMTINKDITLTESLSQVKQTLSQAMDSIRNSVHNLHDEAIDLYSQINGLITGFRFCPVNLDYDISDNVDIKLKYSFIAIVKEALSNIIRHSSATQVYITLREHPVMYQLIIQDNGKVKDYSMESGIGLNNISKRVNAFNGNLHINIEKGFKIFISIPKNKQHSGGI